MSKCIFDPSRFPLHRRAEFLGDRDLFGDLVNLTNAGTWRARAHELFPVGPCTVQVKLPDGDGGRNVRLLVSGAKSSASVRNGWSRFEVKSVLDHEVILIQ